MRLPTGWAGLAAGACIALGIACASAQRPATAPPVMQTSEPPQGAHHDEIAQLSAQIDDERTQLKLPEQHGIVNNATPMGVSPVAPTCARQISDTCTQTCTLADSICDNSKKICAIADELAGDAWAAQKCADGKATCSAATQRCCECTS